MRAFLLMLVGIVLTSTAFLMYGFKIDSASESQLAAAPATSTVENIPNANNAEKETYRVLKVVDGDTLSIEMNSKSVTVRLIGLDTPETSDPRKPVQCFGREASNKAKELLTG